MMVYAVTQTTERKNGSRMHNILFHDEAYTTLIDAVNQRFSAICKSHPGCEQGKKKKYSVHNGDCAHRLGADDIIEINPILRSINR